MRRKPMIFSHGVLAIGPFSALFSRHSSLARARTALFSPNSLPRYFRATPFLATWPGENAIQQH